MDAIKTIAKIEQKGSLRIILILSKENMLPSRLQNTVGVANETFYKAKRQLTELGIIEEKNIEWSTYKPFILTEKGKKIAEHLQTISDIISE